MSRSTREERYVSVKEVSRYTSIPVKTLYEWASLRRIPSVKVGSRVLFDLNDIDSFMASLKRDTEHSEKIIRKVIADVC